MPITLQELIATMPLLLLTATVIVVMLAIAIKRSHSLTCVLSITGISISFLAVFSVLPYAGTQVTPLLIVDSLSLLFSAIILLIAAFIAIFSFPYLANLGDQKEEYYLLLLLAALGALILVTSNHFISAFLGLETLSISLYGMIAYPVHSKGAAKFPLEASFKYLILSAVSSTFILFGIALLYSQTGSLGFASLTESLNNSLSNTPMIATGMIMLTSGIAFKLSLAPFHMWTPDVYEGAPLPATAFLATIGKVGMFVLMLRFIFATDALQFEAVVGALTFLAVVSILLGNILALLQQNIKRILAYSSIAHMGYILIALVAYAANNGVIAVEAISFYLIAYLIMSLGAFGVAAVVSSSEKEYDFVNDYQGLFWRDPWLATLFTAMLLSLAGIPLTAGFIGKFYIMFAGVQGSQWLLLIALVIGSGLGIYYYLRIVYRMLLPSDGTVKFAETGGSSIGSYAVLTILLVALIVLGVYPTFLMSILESVATSI